MEIKATITFLVNLLRPYKKLVSFLIFLAAIASVGDVVIPIVYGRVLDVVLKKQPLITLVGLLVAWFILRLTVAYLRRKVAYHGGRLGDQASLGFIRKLEGKFLDFPLGFHHEARNQDTYNRVAGLRWNLNNFLEWGLFDLGPGLLAAIAMTAYIFVLDYQVALVLAIGLVALLLNTALRSRKFLNLADDVESKERDASSRIWDMLRNVLIVKSCGREESERQFIQRENEQFNEKAAMLARHHQGTNARNETIATLGILGALSFAAVDVYRDVLTAGQFLSIVGYAYAIFNYVMYGHWQFVAFLRIVSRYKVVREIELLPTEDYESGTAITLRGGIEYKNVRFQYREGMPLLTDVNFIVQAGEQVAIVGESGEGKTTIVELLGRYMMPQSGSISVDGHDAREINLRALRGQMAYVPQDLTLFHDTIGANIRYGRRDASEAQAQEAIRKAHLEEFVAKLPEGLNTKVGERGLKLSAGERQRVALARAFLRDPKILILDEPTSNLDAKTEELIRGSLEELMKGRTTIIIAHRLRTIREADKILVLKDGRIVEEGKHNELEASGGIYKALLDAQTGLMNLQDSKLEEVEAAE